MTDTSTVPVDRKAWKYLFFSSYTNSMHSSVRHRYNFQHQRSYQHPSHQIRDKKSPPCADSPSMQTRLQCRTSEQGPRQAWGSETACCRWAAGCDIFGCTCRSRRCGPRLTPSSLRAVRVTPPPAITRSFFSDFRSTGLYVWRFRDPFLC